VLTGPPSHIPFQITVQVCGQGVPQTLIDEGASVSILSSIAWHALGCPQLAPVTQNLLSFNRRTTQPLGTLPQFSITLGGKTVFIDVIVITEISSANGYKNPTSSNSYEVTHGPKLPQKHFQKVQNYTTSDKIKMRYDYTGHACTCTIQKRRKSAHAHDA
jgi:hypothetical protein